MPVRWEEVEKGIALEDFRLDNAPVRIHREGDLYRPLLLQRGRVRLDKLL
jgi:bifunctional non-homologous end joining protein LigD